jgi:predicted ester cyclase
VIDPWEGPDAGLRDGRRVGWAEQHWSAWGFATEVGVMGIEDNKRVVERLEEVVAARDVGRLDEVCTPDMVNHALAPGRPAGLAGTREFLTTMAQRFENDHWESSFVVAEGDLVVQFGVRGGHWRGGDFLGFPAPSGNYARDVAFAYRIADGRVSERWAIRDDLGMLRQLGVLPK